MRPLVNVLCASMCFLLLFIMVVLWGINATFLANESDVYQNRIDTITQTVTDGTELDETQKDFLANNDLDESEVTTDRASWVDAATELKEQSWWSSYDSIRDTSRSAFTYTLLGTILAMIAWIAAAQHRSVAFKLVGGTLVFIGLSYCLVGGVGKWAGDLSDDLFNTSMETGSMSHLFYGGGVMVGVGIGFMMIASFYDRIQQETRRAAYKLTHRTH